MSTQPTGRGRPQAKPERKKHNYTVILTDGEDKELRARYGSLTLAIRSVLIQDKPDTLPTIRSVIEQLQKLTD